MAKHRDGPLKVLMINTVPMCYEGITTVMLNYAENMDRTGLQLDFLAINDVEESLRARIAVMGAQLYVIEGRNRHPLRYLRTLRRLIRANGYQVVHAHGNSCTLAVEMLAARLGGARARCAHSHNTTCNSALVHRLLRGPFEVCCTHRFACGEAAGQWLFRDKPFAVLNNGIDAARYAFDSRSRAAHRARLGLEGRRVVGHVGSFNAQKNHAFLIEAFDDAARRDPSLCLVLVGDGPTRPDIEAMVGERGLGDRVIFTGVSREVPGLLSAMDVMALPSRFEGLPNVVIEWQAAGLPALVADTVTPACRLTELVRFLPLDAKAWTRALMETPVDADRAAASAGAAQAIAAAGYDIRDSAKRLRRLYFECAGLPLPPERG